MAKRNILNFFRRIFSGSRRAPVVGIGEWCVTMHSRETDLACSAIHDWSLDLDEGISIGKRSLDGLHHWCIRVDRTIYELNSYRRNRIRIDITRKHDDPLAYESRLQHFSWTMITAASPVVNEQTLHEFAKSFEANVYAVLPSSNEHNSQSFVIAMYAKTRGVSPSQADLEILDHMPSGEFWWVLWIYEDGMSVSIRRLSIFYSWKIKG